MSKNDKSHDFYYGNRTGDIVQEEINLDDEEEVGSSHLHNRLDSRRNEEFSATRKVVSEIFDTTTESPPFCNRHNVPTTAATIAATACDTTTESSPTNGENAPYTGVDILCEKGGRANHHPGNRVFLRLIRCNREAYRKLATKQDRDALIRSILLSIQRNGGRFVQRVVPSSSTLRSNNKNTQVEEEEWDTVSWKRAYQKVRQAVREPDHKVHKSAAVANDVTLRTDRCKYDSNHKPAPQQVIQSNHPIEVQGTAMQQVQHIREDDDPLSSYYSVDSTGISCKNHRMHSTGYQCPSPPQEQLPSSFASPFEAYMMGPPVLQRHISGPAPPLEMLLERHDSLCISHLFEVVEDCRQDEREDRSR